MRIINLESLSDQQILESCKKLYPFCFVETIGGTWEVLNYFDLGLDGEGKRVINDKNDYYFDFDFGTRNVRVMNNKYGDIVDSVGLTCKDWWIFINFLKTCNCELV